MISFLSKIYKFIRKGYSFIENILLSKIFSKVFPFRQDDSSLTVLFLISTAISVIIGYRTVKITKNNMSASKNIYKILKPKCSSME